MPTPSPTPGRGPGPAADRAVARWLLACCAMIFVMVVLGGVTRLSHAGLSMVEWRPLLGWLPPMSEAAWAEVFDKYRAYPEYQKLNAGMTLAEFKGIYWLEYVHRLWGRAIGVVFLVPFAVFLSTGRIRRELAPHLVAMFVLGALQGGMGWYMVRSGLVDHPDVSAYRLTVHLGFAFVIYGYILWVALGLWPRTRAWAAPARPGLRRGAWAVAAVVFLTLLSGGFVAGLDAGFTFNTFPLMGGRWVPAGVLELEPWPVNFFENVATVQFTHRVAAIITLLAVVAFWARAQARRGDLPQPARAAAHGLAAMAAVQVGLGISTLLLVVPLPLAAAHQAGALLLFTAALVAAHTLTRRRLAAPAPAGAAAPAAGE